MSYVPRLKKKYDEEIAAKLMEQFGYSSPMQIPKVLKVSVNQGLGDATSDKKIVDVALNELGLITGQKAVPTKATKSISNFKLREDMTIGARVTLRKVYMWEFLDRLINVALPRVRDFRGINDKSFDGRGNYSMGIKEQIIFPEINMDKVTKIMGLGIQLLENSG